MCNASDYTPGCRCYRSAGEARDERRRIASASRLEHEVLALLRGQRIAASERAIAFAALLAPHHANIADIHATENAVYYWLRGDGVQHRAQLAAVASVRLVA